MTLRTYAIVDNGVVINATQWDGLTEWAPDVGVAVLVPEGLYFNIGWLYDGTSFIDPNPDVPPSNIDLYKQAVAARNAVYSADIDKMNIAWGVAGLFDGTSEAPKKETLKTNALALRATYIADLAQLKIDYGV